MKFTLPFNPSFLFTISLCNFVFALDCPQIVYIELGKDGIINCQINSGDVYWYKGNSTKTSPIVRLENRQKEILEESGSYDIDKDGSLIIKQLKEQHHGLYSVVNFYDNIKHDTGQTKVEIAVKPQTVCPIIAGCDDCNQCVLTESSEGNISCSISGARPQVHLNIVTDTGNWINVILNVSEEIYDRVTNTWTTTTTVRYSGWYDCTTPLQLRCLTDNKHPFELSDSVAHVRSGLCKTATPISGYQTPLVDETKKMYVFRIAIIIGVIFVVTVLVLGIIFCRKSGIRRQRNAKERDIETPEETYLLLQTISQGTAQPLTDRFKKVYNCLPEFIYTPARGCFSVDDVFEGINFTLTKADNGESTISISELMETLSREGRSFIFIDDGEFFRKAFVQYICSNVCQQNQQQDIILFAIPKDADRNINIAEVIYKELNSDEKLSSYDIQNILKTQKCLLVFDEVHELKKSHEDHTRSLKNMHPSKVTIDDILTGSNVLQTYQKARCLLTSKNKTDVKPPFAEPQVHVKIAPLSSKSLKPYVTSILKYYQQGHVRSSSVSTGNTQGKVDNRHSELHEDIAQDKLEQDATCVTNLILEKENIIEQTEMCPSSLILLIHLLISDVTNRNIDNLKFYIHRRSYLTRLILDSLQFQYSPTEAKYGSFQPLMLKLGKATLENYFENPSFTETSNLNYEYTRTQLEEKIGQVDFATAFSMGLLKPVKNGNCSKDIAINDEWPPRDSLVEFRHRYIQESLSAQTIVYNEIAYQNIFKSLSLSTDGKLKRLLTFMTGSDEIKRRELLEKLVKEKKWNILIECLFECENDDDLKKSVLSPLNGIYSVNIIDMDEHYHSMAVDKFCQDLVKYDVSPRALTFRKACPFEYFSKMKIPRVEFLIFFDINFQGKQNFILFVRAACRMNVVEKIQFVQCTYPDNISEEEMQHIVKDADDLSVCSLPKIVRTDDVVSSSTTFYPKFIDSPKWEQLNLLTGCWEKI